MVILKTKESINSDLNIFKSFDTVEEYQIIEYNNNYRKVLFKFRKKSF